MRSKFRRLFKLHPEYIGFVLRAVYTVLALLISVLLARLLGPAALGRYFAVAAGILLLSTIVQSGWTTLLVRETAALRELRKYAELRGITSLAIRVVILLSIVACLFCIVLSRVFDAFEISQLSLIGAPIILLLSTSSLRQAITRGMGRPLLGQLCENVTRPVIQLIGLVLLAIGLFGPNPTPTEAMIVWLLAIVASAILAFVLERQAMAGTGTDRKLPRWSEWVPTLARMSVIAWAQAINLQIGTLVLAALATDAQVGKFRIAQQISLLLPFGLTVVTALYAKDFSRLFVQRDSLGMERLAAKGALISGLTAFVIGLPFMIGGRSLMNHIYGAGFQGAFLPLQILIVGQLINNFIGPVTVICIATRSETAAMIAHLASVAANVILCLVLVPIWQANGAAFASAVSLSIWNVALFVVLKKRFGINVIAGGFWFKSARQNS